MHPIDPAELSAFLDGELPAERADEVRAALARDPALRQSLRAAGRLDADWQDRRPRRRCFGRGCTHRPYSGPLTWTAAGVVGLLLVRVALKAPPPLFGVGLECAIAGPLARLGAASASVRHRRRPQRPVPAAGY